MGPDASAEGQNKIEIQCVVPRWPGVRGVLSVVRDPSGRTTTGRSQGDSLRFREKTSPFPRSLNRFVPVGT